jgi:hypothetical protein
MSTTSGLVSLGCGLIFVGALGACGGKVADEQNVGTKTVVIPVPTAPVDAAPPDPGPLDPGPTPPTPPPPPTVDASVPTDRLVAGSPQCTKTLPANGASCRSLFGYSPKCEYEVSSTNGGTCRWFCYCVSADAGTGGSEWMCSKDTCS